MPFIERDGTTVYTEVVEGEGTPVFLHTGGGGDSSMWREAGYVDGLAGRKLILFDHRGHGRSGRPQGADAHLMERYVDDVVAVLDHLEITRCSFVGYSAGGSIGYALAGRDPSRLRCLTTIDAWDEPDPDPVGELQRVAAIRADGMERLLRELRDDEPVIPPWFEQQMRDTDVEMFALLLAAWTHWPGDWAAAPDVSVPTLMIGAALHDEAAGAITAFAARFPSGRIVIERGVGHVGLFVRSELVLRSLLPFLDSFD